jgi:streptogramin lyase
MTGVLFAVISLSLGLGTVRAWALEERTLPAELVTTLTESGGGRVAFGPEGWLWTAEGEMGIGRFNREGQRMSTFTVKTGEEPDEPRSSDVTDIVEGSDGNMWFSDWGQDTEEHNLIGRITPTGEISEWPVEGPLPWTTSLTRGSDGAIWFLGGFGFDGFVGRISPPEENVPAIEELTIPTGHAADLPLPDEAEPVAIALGPDGDTWFSVRGFSRDLVGHVSHDGHFQQYLLPHEFGPAEGLIAGPDGNLWFIRGEAIGRISPTGAVQEFPLPDAIPSGSLTVGPDGDLWFGIRENGSIGRITSAGVVTVFKGATPYSISAFAQTGGPYLWYSDGSRLLRLTVPLAPAAIEAPTVTGVPTQGGTLSVGTGTWQNGTGSFSYQWESCDPSGTGCMPLPGEVGSQIVASSSDIGRTLRAIVTASNVAGSASTSSNASGVIAAPAQGVSASSAQAHREITSTASWKFGWNSHFTIVQSLVLHDLPTGAHIETRCVGRGCPFGHHTYSEATAADARCHRADCRTRPRKVGAGELDLAPPLRGHRLGPKARLTIAVTAPEYVGKQFSYTVRTRRGPLVQIGCLRIGSTVVSIKCS